MKNESIGPKETEGNGTPHKELTVEDGACGSLQYDEHTDQVEAHSTPSGLQLYNKHTENIFKYFFFQKMFVSKFSRSKVYQQKPIW